METSATAASLHQSRDATAAGFPKLSELTVTDNSIVRVTAGVDIAVRTVAATLVAATFATTAVRPAAVRRELEHAAFYAGIASTHDVAIAFPPPVDIPSIHRRRVGRAARALSVSEAEAIHFCSSFEPINPVLRPLWNSFAHNNTACAQHWRHPDGPRPTLIVIHGFFASTYLLNSVFLQLPWFYKAGFDVVLFTLPHHGARAERWSPYSGHGYFAHGASGFVESTRQAIHALRVLIDHLEATGVDKVGVTGISLGGYTSALLAAVEPRLDVAVPNVPVVDVRALLDSWFPASYVLRTGLRKAGGTLDAFDGLSLTSPLNYRPVVPVSRRLIITGPGDRLAPPEQSAKLWEHWDHCALHWFPGNHLMHLSQPDYLRRMIHFMRDADFVPDSWRTSRLRNS